MIKYSIFIQKLFQPLTELNIKLIYSAKATKVCKMFTIDLSYVVPVKSTVEILQNFVVFSEYMNFNIEECCQEDW